MKKLIALALTLALTATAAIGGTLAYMSAEDQEHNTVAFGNIEIEQLEYQRVVNDGAWIQDSNYNATFGSDTYTPDKLEPFSQDKTLMPAVGSPAWDDRNGSQNPSGAGSHQQSWKEIGAPGSNQLFDDSFANVIDKFVFVKNTGNNDCYYRTIIAFENPVGHEGLVGINWGSNSRFDYNQKEAGKQYNDGKKYEFIPCTIDGTQYAAVVATYTEILTPDEISRPSLLQVYLMGEADNEDVEAFGDKLDVLVYTQAVQAGGWTEDTANGKSAAQVALEAQFGVVDAAMIEGLWS